MEQERGGQPVPDAARSQEAPALPRAETKKVPEGRRPGEPLPMASDDDAYDLSAMLDNRMVNQYAPAFLAKGGEHIVYVSPMAPDVVVKVDAMVMRKLHRSNAERGLPLDQMDPDVLPHVEEKMRNDRERYLRLRGVFGRAHVPGMKQGIVLVPVTEKLLIKTHRGMPPGDVKGITQSWAIVKVQKRAPEIDKPGTLSVTAGYAEHRSITDQAKYAEATAAYVDGANDGHASAEARKAVSHFDLNMVMQKAVAEPAAAEALKDFTAKTITYAMVTGEILDFAGGDNVTFYRDGDKWNYRLVDALFGHPKMLPIAKEVASRAAKGKALNEFDISTLLNVVNFSRTVNGLADQLGIKERVAWMPEEAKGKIDFLKLLKG